MVEVLKDVTRVARKEYRCMYCGCPIHIGEKYNRQTDKYEGTIYDWIAHNECIEVSQKLNMYDTDYDGLDDYRFQENIDEYLNEFYRDEAIDDVPESINSMTRLEQIKMILADWDKPFIKAHRLKLRIDKLEHLKKWKHSLSIYESNQLEKCLAELKAIEV